MGNRQPLSHCETEVLIIFIEVKNIRCEIEGFVESHLLQAVCGTSIARTMALTPLEPQSRCGDKAV